MRPLLIPIAALLISDAILLAGHGLLLTLLPLRAVLEGFSDAEIAFTGSAYFLGFVAGCLLTPRLVGRVGHIRTFAALATLYSAAALVFDLLPSFWGWLLLRIFAGACISGLYMVIESWLNERAAPENRGTVLSIYTIINLTMMVAGQQLINLSPPEAGTLFAIAAILLSLALVPVSLTVALAPQPLHAVSIDVPSVWRLSHVGLAGSVASGMITGAFWSLGPVYGRGIGLETDQLTMLLSAAVLGGAVFQLPFGRLSDHYDRRLVLFWIAIAASATSVVLATSDAAAWGMLVGLAFVWGGTTMTMYAICLAHANDRAPAEKFVMVGTVILLAHGPRAPWAPPSHPSP